MAEPPIFLDGFSTQPLAPEAREAMLAAWALPGNAGSPNGTGDRAASLLMTGRVAVAHLIGAAPSEITFTSGATEANNLALTGVVRALRARGSMRSRLIVSAIEHKSVLETAAALTGEGVEVVHAPVDAAGRLDLTAERSVSGATAGAHWAARARAAARVRAMGNA